MRILISSYSRKLRGTDKENSKNYPYWEELVKLLQESSSDNYLIQIGVSGEKKIEGVDEVKFNLPLKEIKKLIKECDVWVSVDNFMHHLGWLVGKPGVVIFSQSDPLIFGHSENKNLLKDRKYLRQDQFNTWECSSYIEEAFIEPGKVLDAILGE